MQVTIRLNFDSNMSRFSEKLPSKQFAVEKGVVSRQIEGCISIQNTPWVVQGISIIWKYGL